MWTWTGFDVICIDHEEEKNRIAELTNINEPLIRVCSSGLRYSGLIWFQALLFCNGYTSLVQHDHRLIYYYHYIPSTQEEKEPFDEDESVKIKSKSKRNGSIHLLMNGSHRLLLLCGEISRRRSIPIGERATHKNWFRIQEINQRLDGMDSGWLVNGCKSIAIDRLGIFINQSLSLTIKEKNKIIANPLIKRN